MHLKSIEINGFKSFANRITFEFPHGITGIVGPNGSGKSNIGDAVRWVLGEQSAKQLRGSRMEDVIFSGTENRKPMGLAYVAMVFDNTDRELNLDYDEVKVARRVYRSGESEYLLNGSACRRKDIVEIFYDTGIGKDGYSMIGQGQVEKILSGKIEDSRELFDEAAGIAKYKKNRTVMEKSLDQERQNMERVTDVLNELEQRVGPLERQSKKAREYLKLKDREKDLDLHLFLYDQDRLKKEEAEISRQYEITESDLNSTRKEASAIKERNALLSEEIEETARRLEDLSSLREEANADRENLDSRKQELSLKIDSNERLAGHYQELISSAKQEIKEKEAAKAGHQKEKEDLIKSVHEKKELQKQQDLDIEILKKKREGLSQEAEGKRDRLFSMISSDTDAREKMSRYQTMEEQLSIRNAEYNSRLITFQTERKDTSERLESLRREHDQVVKEETVLSDQEEDLTARKEILREEEKSLSLRLEKENQDMMRARSQYETLRNISERYDGYQNSIRSVMEQKKSHTGILGVVADLLSMEKKYETAIEIALGGALQNIVTEDNETAKKMIAYLKKHRLGRATFLPLSNIRKKNISISPYVLEEEGVIGVASSLVDTEKRYEDLVVSLLGRTIVVDTIDHALFLNRKNNYSLRIVTLDGELLNPGGAITGGAFRRHSGNLLGRRREVEEYRDRMKTKQEICVNLREELEKKKEERKKVSSDLEEITQELSGWRLRLHDLSQQLPEEEKHLAELERSILSVKAEHQLLKEQLKEIAGQMEQLSRHQESSEKLHEENSSVIDQLNRQIEDLETEIATREEERNALLLDISREEQQLVYLDAQISRLEQETAGLKAQQEENENKALDLERQNQDLRREIDGLSADIEKSTKRINELNEDLSRIRQTQKEQQTLQNRIVSELSEKNERLILLEKDADRMRNRLEKIKESIDSQIDHMWEEYEITYNYALELKRYDIVVSEVAAHRKELKEVNRQIRQLGSVNINAIEEFKEVGERYEFMKGQCEDIQKAEDHLKDLIKELNHSMKDLFTEQFANIRTAFQKVFTELFQGGKADLQLMDEDLLECGIRIVAQPPGKKLQNILLLSGGERALTAIALLFAIQQLKPSSFCLLDEIEAALDDANIIRFSRYLKQLSKDTQFIIITHRRGTMTAADALYGITMQEKGISTLISVDLIDEQLDR